MGRDTARDTVRGMDTERDMNRDTDTDMNINMESIRRNSLYSAIWITCDMSWRMINNGAIHLQCSILMKKMTGRF
jgi:hypothetical protein